MTAFGSFNNNMGKRVLDLLEAGDLRLRQVVCIVRTGVQPTLDPYAEAFI